MFSPPPRRRPVTSGTPYTCLPPPRRRHLGTRLFRCTCQTPPPATARTSPPLPVAVDSSSLMCTCPSPTYPPPPRRRRPDTRHFRCTCLPPTTAAVLAPTLPVPVDSPTFICTCPFHPNTTSSLHPALASDASTPRRLRPPASLLSHTSGKFCSIRRCGPTGRRRAICHRLEHGPIRREPSFKI